MRNPLCGSGSPWQLQMQKQNWLPWCAFTSTQHKGVIFHWPVAMWFPVSLLEAFAPQCCWQGCFCENFLFCFCQGYSILLEPFKWQLSSNSPCFGHSEFGSLLRQVHDERQMGPFPFFSSIPSHSPAIQLFPISSFFCFLSYFCFKPQPSFEFYCYMPWFSMFLFLVFLSPCLWFPFC